MRDARYQIDNNLVENAVRPLALGRKNFLFCGNHDSAIRAAVIYSLVSTCKEHAVDPRKWMEDVLVKIPQYENQKLDLRKLLPHNWQKEANFEQLGNNGPTCKKLLRCLSSDAYDRSAISNGNDPKVSLFLSLLQKDN